jgi:hypothetical protein
MSQNIDGDVATLVEQVTDPDFQRLSGSFRTAGSLSPEQIPFSRKMERFLDLFAQEFAKDFSANDAERIASHRDAWWKQDYVAIINLANARAFLVLNPFYKMSFDELATGRILEYVAAVERIEADMEGRLTAHHNKLLKGLSRAGQSRVRAILDRQIAGQLSDSVVPTLDLRAFATAYPGVMARQLLREASQLKGPPPELEIREIREGPVVMVGTFPKEEK